MDEREHNLGRRERRIFERAKKRMPNEPRADSVVLQGMDTLLDDSVDLEVCTQELKYYKQAEYEALTKLRYYKALRSVGISEEAVRRAEISIVPGQTEYDKKTSMILAFREAEPRKLLGSQEIIKFLQGQLPKDKNFYSEEIETWLELLQDREIPLADLFVESIRSRKESVGLLTLQVEWLKERLENAKSTRLLELPIEPAIESLAEPFIYEEPFLLQDWDLKWTTHFWSTNPNHLVPISTINRKTALHDLQNVSFGEIMIKPSSILNALEFHLRKDVIQRALATRMKYGPQGIGEWIKLKRGRDRILFRIQDDKKAIAFAGNRDIIYRKN